LAISPPRQDRFGAALQIAASQCYFFSVGEPCRRVTGANNGRRQERENDFDENAMMGLPVRLCLHGLGLEDDIERANQTSWYLADPKHT